MAQGNPFYAFDEKARPHFVRFDRDLEKYWLTPPADDWLMGPNWFSDKTLPYGAALARVTMPNGVLEFVRKEHDTVFTYLSSLFRDYSWEKYEAAVEDDAEKIASDVFDGWNDVGEAAAVARRDKHVEAAADVLNSNPKGWDDLALFHTAHLVNLQDTAAGTQPNLHTGLAFNATNLSTGITHFNGVKNLRGKVFGWEPDEIVFPTALKESVLDLVLPERKSTSGDTTTDKFRGRLKPVWIPQLTSSTRWYLRSTKYKWFAPIVRVRGNGGALERISYGMDSEKYRDHQKIGMKWIDRFRYAAGLYQGIMAFDA
jgi:hypothetical protein